MSCVVILLGTLLLAAPWATAPAGAATVEGELGAVAAEHSLASQAGVEILRAGGNAVDAAVAAALATGVVNPSSSGLGGGGFLVLYTADEGRVHALDFRERAPAAAHRNLYARDGKADTRASKIGGLAVGVPGEVAGFATALKRFGTKSFAEVAAPAIGLATEGFVVQEHLAKQIERAADEMRSHPAIAEIFLRENGTPYKAGEVLKRPGLASTLSLLAREGAEAFYRGPLADEIVAAARNEGGIIGADDLATYATVERQPVTISFNGWTLVAMPPPSSGGGTIAEVLSILAPYRLRDLGSGSVTYLHLLAEALKAAFADRAHYYGDSDFVDVPLARLTSPEHAEKLRSELSAVRARPSSAYGNTAAPHDAGTTHISVIDRWGNGAALTTSVNTSFGSMVAVPRRGIVLNNTMDDFSIQPGVPNAFGLIGNEANAVAANKRPLSSMSPTLVVGKQGLRLVAGASGGPMIISSTLQTVLATIAFGKDIGSAVATTRIHQQWMPEIVGVEPSLDPAVRAGLERRGHALREFQGIGSCQAVEVITVGGKRRVRAASDDRKGGQPAAE